MEFYLFLLPIEEPQLNSSSFSFVVVGHPVPLTAPPLTVVTQSVILGGLTEVHSATQDQR